MDISRTNATRYLAITSGVLFALMAVCDGESARADVTLELVGSGEYTVGQAFPNSPDEVFPITGDSVVIWATLTNVGQDVFEATGPGGAGGPSTGTIGLWTSGLLTEYWDPDADPNDGMIETPLGYCGVQLDPGESLTIALIEVWGMSHTTFQPAEIGDYATWPNLTMGFWEGLDRDPNDPNDISDLTVCLDQGFTVTVVPEAHSLATIVLGTVVLMRRREFSLRQDNNTRNEDRRR